MVELAPHHQARLGAGPVGAEDEADVLGCVEALEQPRQPALVGRHGVLGEERDVRPAGALASRLRVPPCENSLGRHVDHAAP